MRYAFGDFELDDTTFELRRGGHPIAVRPQALDVLLHLVRARERVVTREELLDAVWSGTAVSSTALAQAILAARRALGDDPDEPLIIQTVRARGYRFILPVIERSDRASTSAAVGAQDEGVIGRAEPIAAIERMLGDARAGRGGVALVTGEPGIGKTRLMNAMAARAAEKGALVATVRCHDDAAAPPLWPWISLLRELARDGVASAELAAHPELAALVAGNVRTPSAADADEGSPDAHAQSQFRLADHVARLLRAVGRARPLFLVLDDMQWADEESLTLTKFVARELGSSTVLLCVVYRATSAAPSTLVAKTMGALARADSGRTIVLHGLTHDDVASLAREIHGRPLSDRTTAQLFEKTNGNPLFVTQLVHGMHGRSTFGSGVGATSAMLSTDVMRDAIALHLGELPEPCVHVLGIAAVMGRTFTLATLAGASGLDSATLLPLLDHALGARILARSSSKPGEHRFVHALVRDVLYRRLPVAERVRIHGAAGDAILAHTPLPEGDALDAVAAHFAEAATGGEIARALTWAIRAAAAAPDEDAIEHLERAARALEHAPSAAGSATKDAVDALDAALESLATRAPSLAARARTVRSAITARRG